MSPQKRKNKKAEKAEAEVQRPSIKGTGASLFFPSARKKQKGRKVDDGRTHGANYSRTTVEQPRPDVARVAKYRRAWKKKGLTQVSMWLPGPLVARLKRRALKEKKKISAVCAELLGGKKYD